MAYKALYRKYRPSTFEEVIGQQSIVATLLNAINTNKLAHAYLFCGPRGTGKTSIAKLLAKTINCQNEGKKPCGACQSCVEIQESSHPDVIELDAATNNGVDEVREIIDQVKYAPMHGKYRVFIIDEVHMMTSSAFNALLKTLEEPPEYCIFILATTEPHKVLPTIISRCQRFDFKKVDNSILAERVKYICEKENVKCSEEAIKLIAELADGGVRDCLSILDQCIAYAQDNITAEDVSAVYGVASTSEKMNLFNCVKNKNAKELAKKVNEISVRGLDIQRLTIDLVNIAKEAVVYSYSKDENILSVISVEQAKQILNDFNPTQLLKYIDYLIETQDRYHEANNALTYFEVCLLKMMDYAPQSKVIEKVIEKVVEKPIEKNETTTVEKKVNLSNTASMRVVENIFSLSDEQINSILLSANKKLKEEAGIVISKIDTTKLNQDDSLLINIIKSSSIMATSSNMIIFDVETRQNANLINELGNKKKIEAVLSACFNSAKGIIAVTNEERDYYINYFKAHQSNNATNEVKTNEHKEINVDDTQEVKMINLFGKDGFDVVED